MNVRPRADVSREFLLLAPKLHRCRAPARLPARGHAGPKPLRLPTLHRGEAHQRCDLTFFTYTLLASVARPVDVPWRVRSRPFELCVRIWSRLVWILGTPLLAVSWIADRFLGPVLRREGWSNTYRVLARRRA